ncbi:extensin-like domain-containing protein [Rhizobium sp.]
MNGPLPAQRPDAATSKDDTSTGKSGNDGEMGKQDQSTSDDGKTSADTPVDTYLPPPIEKEDPKQLAACTAELKAMGAEFTEAKPIDDGDGCGIDRPLELKSAGNGVKLSPPGVMRCRTAVNLARWSRDVVIPMLRKAQPDEELAEISQASTYVCRKRNNAPKGKISEHAHGNAVDIAGFTFKSGNTFTIVPREEDSTLNGAFQRSIASAACLYFSTVLDPGSDKAHETHLHLDTLKRKGGYRYCW